MIIMASNLIQANNCRVGVNPNSNFNDWKYFWLREQWQRYHLCLWVNYKYLAVTTSLSYDAVYKSCLQDYHNKHMRELGTIMC